MSQGNGHGRIPVDVIDLQFSQVVEIPPPPAPKRPIWPAVVMFLLTVITTMAVGAQLAASYALNEAPFSNVDSLLGMLWEPLKHPALLLTGIPFSFTLLAILFAHE